MTTPDIDAIATYGGALNNYSPIVDPTTDRDAAMVNKALCSTAAMTQTAVRAWVRFLTHATTPTLASSNICDGLWPNILGNRPAPTRSGTGTFLLTWPSSLNDELGVSHTLNFRAAAAFVENTTLNGFVLAKPTAANVITVYTFNTSFAANDLAGTTILVLAF